MYQHTKGIMYTNFESKASVQTGMQNNSKFSNMHHHEWSITAGCGANSCCSRRDRRVEVLALSYTRHMKRLNFLPRLHLRLSPPLEHTGHPCLCM